MADTDCDVREMVYDLEERRRVAVDAGDVATLSPMLADGYQQVHADGTIDDKSSALARVASYRGSSEPRRPEMLVFGDVAIMKGPAVRRAVVDGVAREGWIYTTQIAAREGGVWRFVHAHATLMPPPST